MKRFLSLLLVLSTLLSLFPMILPTAAEETEALPKDESEGEGATLLSDDGRGMTAYDSLYVGADGSETAYGGKLIGLYTAFAANDASVTLSSGTTNGKWLNKMDATGATDAILRDSYATKDWEFGNGRGIGYEMTAAQWKNGCRAIGITMPDAWAELADFTVEQCALLDAISNTGTLSSQYSALRLDLLLGLWLPSDTSSNSAERYTFRWSYGVTQSWSNTLCEQEYNYYKIYAANYKTPVAMNVRYYKQTGDKNVKFGLQYENLATYEKSPYTPEEYVAAKQTITDGTATNTMPIFSLFNGVPGEMYALRVYDAPLTQAEFDHNSCIDMLAYADIDVTKYTALSSSAQSAVDGFMARYSYAATPAEIQDAFYGVVWAYEKAFDVGSSFYVTEGLVLLLASYHGYDSGSFAATTGGGWFNALNAEQTATLKGNGWYKNTENGGLSIERTYSEYLEDRTFGVYLPQEALPAEDYTLELVANPVGISTINENGERERYIDTITRTGTYNEYGIGIGALRCLQFACYRPDGKDGQMERRWVYNATGGLSALNWQYRFSDITWQGLEYDEIVSYGITHDYADSTSAYSFFDNRSCFSTLDIGSDEYKTPAEAGNMFRVMVGVAGTVFSVRAYNRVLTEAEMKQNHAADIICYYNLDTTILQKYIEAGFDKDTLFAAVATLDFSMSDEEAQTAFDLCLISTWLRYDGVGIRKDGEGGVRYYFTVDEAALARIAALGFTVELGILANVGKTYVPLYNVYDYKITAYEDNAKTVGFFIDEDTFALTVLYSDTDKASMLTDVLVQGYLRLIDEAGEETVLYLTTETEDFLPNSLFDVYAKMCDNENVKDVPALCEQIETAVRYTYDDVVVHLQAGAPAGGDGSIGAPYHSFADAFAACKSIMAKVNTPTKLTLLLGDGEYGVYGTATLSAEEMPYRHLYFTVSSETGNAAFTTTKSMDVTGFTDEGNGIWSYQFEADENGEYPAFRYLYVDGRMQDYSYIATRHARDDNTYQSPYDRTFDAVHAAVEALYKAGTLTMDSVASYPADRVDLHTAFDDYKVKFLALQEEKAIYNAGELTIGSASTMHLDNEVYQTAFNHYKLTDLIIDDLQAQYNAATEKTIANFRTFQPTQYTDNADYVALFEGIRNLMSENRNISSFSSYRAYVETTAIDNAKVYLPLELLAGFESKIEAMDPAVSNVLAERAAALVAEAQATLTAAQAAKTAADAIVAEKEAAVTVAYEAFIAASYEERPEKQALYNLAVCEKERAASLAGIAATDVTEAETALAEAEKKAELSTSANAWRRYALEGSGLEIHWSGQWWYDILDISGVDYEDLDASGKNVACYLDPEEYKMFFVHAGYSMKGRNICIKGSLSFVDSENEFYYDEKAGKVYTYQPDGVEGKSFSYPTCDHMFVLTEVKNVTFDSVTFTGVDDYYMSTHACCLSLSGVESLNGGYISDRSAMRLYSCFGLTLFNCEFRELGCKALHGSDKLENITIDSCTFERVGANAIYLGEGGQESVRVDTSHYVENISLINNYVHQIGLEYHSATAIWINLAKDVKILYNTVDDCAYTAISVGYTFGDPTWTAGDRFHVYNTEIAYNYITNFMTEIGDGGAIYTTGGNSHMEDTRYFNYLHDNYIVMSNLSGDGLGHMICGIYFDGSSSNWLCYDNVVAEQSYGSIAGEADDLYAAGDKYVRKLRNRRSGSTYIYIQHIEGQETHNILCENNYILNARAETAAALHKEVYKTYVVAERNLVERNTHYVRGVTVIPGKAELIAAKAGAVGYKGNTDLLQNNDY